MNTDTLFTKSTEVKVTFYDNSVVKGVVVKVIDLFKPLGMFTPRGDQDGWVFTLDGGEQFEVDALTEVYGGLSADTIPWGEVEIRLA